MSSNMKAVYGVLTVIGVGVLLLFLEPVLQFRSAKSSADMALQKEMEGLRNRLSNVEGFLQQVRLKEKANGDRLALPQPTAVPPTLPPAEPSESERRLHQQLEELRASVRALEAKQEAQSKANPPVAPTLEPAAVPQGSTPRPTLRPVNRSVGRGGVMYAEPTSPQDAMVLKKMKNCYGVLDGDGPLTNEAVLEGKTIRPRLDKPLRPLTAASLEAMRAKAPCIQRMNQSRDDPFRVRVIACTLTRNRMKIASEWALWWHLLGAEELLIFDDGSNDKLYENLAPMIDAGIVKMESVPEPPFTCFTDDPNSCIHGGIQVSVYSLCTKYAWRKDAERYERQVKAVEEGKLQDSHAVRFNPTWVAYVDSDEFPVLPVEGTCLFDVIEKNIRKASAESTPATPSPVTAISPAIQSERTEAALEQPVNATAPIPTFDTRFGQLALPWRIVFRYGSFIDVARTQFEWNNYPRGRMDHYFAVKSIARSDLVNNFNSMHWAKLKSDDYQTWFGDGSLAGPSNSPGYYSVYLRDNHTAYNHSYILHFPVTSLSQLLRRHANGNVAGAKPHKGFGANDVMYWWHREDGNSVKPTLPRHVRQVLEAQNELLVIGLGITDIPPVSWNETAPQLLDRAERQCRKDGRL